MSTKLPRHMVVLDEVTTKRVQLYKERNGIQSMSKALSELIQAGIREYRLTESGALKYADIYQQLDDHGRKVLNAVAELELERCQKRAPPRPHAPIFRMPWYMPQASAGFGNPIDDEEPEILELCKQPPPKASYMITIQGDSMEPLVEDGDMIFVEKTNTADFGDIAVCYNDGAMFLKKLEKRGLVSLNPAYPVIHPEDDFRVLGRFLGVADDSYFP